MEPTESTSPVVISEDPERQRFEAHVDGELAAFLEYVPFTGGIVAMHTQTLPAFQGRGIAGQLVGGVLERLRADGRRLEPRCPYVVRFMERHPEYEDVRGDLTSPDATASPDPVDLSGVESFPASDPPSWWAGVRDVADPADRAAGA